MEDILYIESLQRKRSAKLEAIATQEMRRKDRDIERMASPEYIGSLIHNNIVDDVYAVFRLKDTQMPVKELHFPWCENSGVQECICREKIGVGGSEIL